MAIRVLYAGACVHIMYRVHVRRVNSVPYGSAYAYAYLP
jgi:hypothetical protein